MEKFLLFVVIVLFVAIQSSGK